MKLVRKKGPDWEFSYRYEESGGAGWYYQGRKYLYRLFVSDSQFFPDIWVGQQGHTQEGTRTWFTVECELGATALVFGRGRYVFP